MGEEGRDRSGHGQRQSEWKLREMHALLYIYIKNKKINIKSPFYLTFFIQDYGLVSYFFKILLCNPISRHISSFQA